MFLLAAQLLYHQLGFFVESSEERPQAPTEGINLEQSKTVLTQCK